MTALWEDPDLRGHEGDAVLALANDGHGEEAYIRSLLELYRGLLAPVSSH